MFTPAHTPPSRLTLILITAISVLTLNMFLPALPAMAEDFGVHYGVMSLAIAAYMFLSAALGLVLGPLADRFGRRPVLLTTFAIFALASAFAAMAHAIVWFLAFRMIQAVCATGSTLSRAIVRDMYTPGKGASVLGYIAMAMAIAPMLGPMVGGALQQYLGWRAIFWVFTALGLIGVAIIWSDLGETAPGQGMRWRAQLRGYGEVMRSRAFWSYSAVLAFSISAFFVFLAGAPLVASGTYGLSPSFIGVVLAATPAGYFIGSFVAGRISERADLRRMLVWGRAIGLIGPLAVLIFLAFGVTTPVLVFGLMFTVGTGNGLALPAASTGAMSVRRELAGSASGLSMAIATSSGAVFSALTGWAVTPENGPWMLAALVTLACAAALVAAMIAARLPEPE